MACATGIVINGGLAKWSGSRDKDGYVEYKITQKVRVDDTVTIQEGPAVAMNAVGLFLPGALYSIAGDEDLNAICQWDLVATPMVDERTKFYEVEQTFTNKPNPKCINRSGTGTGTGNPANDPLLEPPKLSGSFVKYTEEKTTDRLGNPIVNSAFERIRGPLAEFDASRLSLIIEKNEATLLLGVKLALIDTVNSDVFYGFDARTVKLSNITWEQLYSGDCICYYNVRYEFEISPEGFDRSVGDEGTKALNGQWNKTTGEWELIDINGSPPDPNNPTHFKRVTDFYGNPMRITLNGAGLPATTYSGTPTTKAGSIDIEYYLGTDFAGEITNLPADLECLA